MRKQIKIAAIGVAGAIGLASAALAQQPTGQAERADRPVTNQMMKQGNAMGGMMAMNDPQMRQQMMEMMTNCNRMMERMGNTPASGRPRT